MTLTPKETELLKDLKTQEQLCIDKYNKHANCACSQNLKNLLNDIAKAEAEHLKTITDMMNGTVAQVPPTLQGNNADCCAWNYSDAQCRKNDEFICQDLLTTEKHASSLYDTCVFEFSDPAARKLLNHIQAEEQQHGERLYAYMAANNMY